MKIYVKSNVQQDDDAIEVRCGIFIDYYYGVERSTDVAAATDETKEADEHRLEYEEFVLRVMNMMRYLKYEIIKEYTHDSINDDSESMYFAFRLDRTILGKKARFIVFIRVSEHPFNMGSRKLQDRDEYYDTQYKKYGLTHGDMIVYPIKVDASDPESVGTAVKTLHRKVKSFTNEAIARVTEDIKEEDQNSDS